MAQKRWNAPRFCVVCELKYIPIRTHQLTCGETCSRLHKLEHEKVKYRSVSPKACVVCKTIFQADRKAKTCSKDCSVQWRNRRGSKKYPPKNCVVCKKEFYGSPRSITCSAECSYQSKLERARRGLYQKDRPSKPCGTCGKMFKPKSLSHQFCGRQCWASNPRKPAEIVKCLRCGDEFTKTKSHQKYCCIDCFEGARKERTQRANWEARGIPRKKVVKCKSCNCNFEQKHSRHVYCSSTCNCDAHRERVRKATDSSPIRPKTCLHCKEKFIPRTRKSMAKFCSNKCRGRYQTVKRQEKREELEVEAKKQVEVKEKWNNASVTSTEVPADSLFPEEILAFIRRGGQITQYLNPVWVEGSKPSEYEDDFITD